METKRIDMGFEVKAIGEDGAIEGYGSVFGNKDSYGDIVAKGAFSGSIREHKAAGSMPALLWQHRSDSPCGVWLEMREDDNGLFMRGKLAMDTVKGKEAHSLLKLGALKGLSIGFMTRDSDYDAKSDIRTIKDVELVETSLVTFPANTKARITGVKSSDEIVTLKDAERVLRDSGFSKQDALAFVSRVKTLSSRSDSDDMGELKASLLALQSKLS
jgi:HK97 family phage prohead protease